MTPSSKELTKTMPDHNPIFESAVAVHAVQDDNATTVVVQVPWGVLATGSSKREPGDRKDYARAYRLALGRALKSLGHQLLHLEADQLQAEADERVRQGILAEQARLAAEEEAERTRPEREARAAQFRAEAEERRKIVETRRTRRSRRAAE